MKKRPSKQDLAIARIPEGGQITEWVHKSHQVARACQAYAVFFGAMAGQGLMKLRQVVGARNFQPTLRESMPWLPVSTAYLYMGYAKRFEKKLKSILPTIGRIDLKSLPDPRDFEAAEESGLLKEAKRSLSVDNYQQLLLALDLMKETKPRGGHHPKKEGAEPDTSDPAVRYYLSLSQQERAAFDRWGPTLDILRREGIEEKSWAHLPERELSLLKGLVLDLGRLLKPSASSSIIASARAGAEDAEEGEGY